MLKKSKRVMKPKIRKNSPEDRAYFKDVAYLVEATHFENHMLWVENHHRPLPNGVSIPDWKQEGMGFMTCIGELAGRPVCVGGFYARINGIRVMFYEATSQVVDHDMVERWLDHIWRKQKETTKV
jgi:hypothetical protein